MHGKQLCLCILVFSLFSCLSGNIPDNTAPAESWPSFYTAVISDSPDTTDFIKISPDSANSSYLNLPGVLLGQIYDEDHRLYAFTSSADGKLHVYTTGTNGSYSCCEIPLPFPAEKIALTAVSWISGDNLACILHGKESLCLIIINKTGKLLERQILPDFLLGPNTDYRLSKTEISKRMVTDINSDGRLLELSGSAEFFSGQARSWILAYNMDSELFLESRLLETSAPNSLPANCIAAGNRYGRIYHVLKNDLGRPSDRNITISAVHTLTDSAVFICGVMLEKKRKTSFGFIINHSEVFHAFTGPFSRGLSNADFYYLAGTRPDDEAAIEKCMADSLWFCEDPEGMNFSVSFDSGRVEIFGMPGTRHYRSLRSWEISNTDRQLYLVLSAEKDSDRFLIKAWSETLIILERSRDGHNLFFYKK